LILAIRIKSLERDRKERDREEKRSLTLATAKDTRRTIKIGKDSTRLLILLEDTAPEAKIVVAADIPLVPEVIPTVVVNPPVILYPLLPTTLERTITIIKPATSLLTTRKKIKPSRDEDLY
jgi:hypothetical protein